MASLCIEITTSKAISAQILRHRSFSFQEFSARYAKVQSCEMYNARRQDTKNRQNSIDDMSEEDHDWFDQAQKDVIMYSRNKYEQALEKGISKESARFLLPQSATSKIYMTGTIRSFLHYVDVRCDKSTQLEHREIAEQIKTVLFDYIPNVAEAMNW
jgi:thymidylate synthase (FAD)